MSNVSSETLDKVMDKEEREKYLPSLRTALAYKHILKRRQEQMRIDVHENEKKVAALELLSGGLGTPPLRERKLTLWDFEKEMTRYLKQHYYHPDVAESFYTRQFAKTMHQKRPYTDEDMDQYAEATVDLIEFNPNPDVVTFWLWAVYFGDWKAMIDAEAKTLGFVKSEKKV